MKREQKGQRFKPWFMCPQLCLCLIACEPMPPFLLKPTQVESVSLATKGNATSTQNCNYFVHFADEDAKDQRDEVLVQGHTLMCVRAGLGPSVCPRPLLSTPWPFDSPRTTLSPPSVPTNHTCSAGKLYQPGKTGG